MQHYFFPNGCPGLCRHRLGVIQYLITNFISYIKYQLHTISDFQVVERRKQIEIEEQEIRRKEKELMSTVKLPAEAEGYKVQTIAEGKR